MTPTFLLLPLLLAGSVAPAAEAPSPLASAASQAADPEPRPVTFAGAWLDAEEHASYAARFLDRGDDNLFHDDLPTQQTEGRFVGSGEVPALADVWYLEMAVDLLYTRDPDRSARFYLADTYGRIGRRLGSNRSSFLALTAWPVDSAPLHLGYSTDLSFGAAAFPDILPWSPGGELRWQKGSTYLRAGVRGTSWTRGGAEVYEIRRYPSILGGLGLPLGNLALLEAGGGWWVQAFFDDDQTRIGDFGAPIEAQGGCAQLSFRSDPRLSWGSTEVIHIADGRPDMVRPTFLEPVAPVGLGFVGQTEIDGRQHTLQSGTGFVTETALAGDLQLRLLLGHWATGIDLLYENGPWTVFDAPSLGGSADSIAFAGQSWPRMGVIVRGSHIFGSSPFGVGLAAGLDYCFDREGETGLGNDCIFGSETDVATYPEWTSGPRPSVQATFQLAVKNRLLVVLQVDDRLVDQFYSSEPGAELMARLSF
jgi:hypothetical protein